MNTALLIIDMQQSLLDEGPWNADILIKRINNLINSAREENKPVIFITDCRVKPDSNVHPSLEFSSSDILIEKSYCDSFLNTSLNTKLEAKGIERLIISGLQTDYCIDTTSRRAASLGYSVILASDAHSTFDHEFLDAERIVHHHNRILRSFPAGKGSVTVVESRKIKFV